VKKGKRVRVCDVSQCDHGRHFFDEVKLVRKLLLQGRSLSERWPLTYPERRRGHVWTRACTFTAQGNSSNPAAGF
jgi:hypothetical protein